MNGGGGETPSLPRVLAGGALFALVLYGFCWLDVLVGSSP